jgi:hypothetical protein
VDGTALCRRHTPCTAGQRRPGGCLAEAGRTAPSCRPGHPLAPVTPARRISG